jgi:hypothetical protein
MNKPSCQSVEERNKKLKELYVWVFTLTDETDYTSSSKHTIRTRFQGKSLALSNTLKKHSHLNLQKLEIITHSGLLTPKKYKTISYRIKSMTESLISTDFEDPIIANLKLKYENLDKVIITKKFQTLLNVLAFIGGISKGIGMILLIFVFPVREVLYYRELMNDMFSVCCDVEQINIATNLICNEDQLADEEDQEQLIDNTENSNEKKFSRKERKKRKSKNKKRTMKKRLNALKGMIKTDVKQSTGLMEAISAGMLTKEAMMDNMMEAFQD